MRFLVLAGALLACMPVMADSAGPAFSHGTNFDEQTGATLYAAICQDCHMANGNGAAGAGRYPSLVSNPKLETVDYLLAMMLHGMNGMPPVGQMMSDAQVAKVVNYVRTHFGNSFSDAVRPEEVAPLR